MEDEEEQKTHTPENVSQLEGIAGIPDFWTKCIKNNKMLGQLVKERDVEVLEKVTDLNIDESLVEGKKVRKVTLTFAENDYFTNEELSVSVKYKDDNDDEVACTIGTEIHWKDGKDVTKKKIKKKQKHKKTNEVRNIVKTVKCDSVFNVFTSAEKPEDLDEGN